MAKSRNHYITVQRLGSGYAALMIAQYEDMNWNEDVVQTGIGRYKNFTDAEDEAKFWAKAENVPYK